MKNIEHGNYIIPMKYQFFDILKIKIKKPEEQFKLLAISLLRKNRLTDLSTLQ